MKITIHLHYTYIRNHVVSHREEWIPIGQDENLMSSTGNFAVYCIVHRLKTNKWPTRIKRSTQTQCADKMQNL